MNRLTGKVALVTGAARGMGATHARLFAAEGAKVVAADILEEAGIALAREIGSAARFLRHDVSKEGDWKRVVAETESVFGPISVLVNNAGIAALASMSELSEALRRTGFA
jgi:3alpha(or 20beta)-hydroxysteroid dehydrogenase